MEALSKKVMVSPKKAKEMQERAKERNLIITFMKNKGSTTIDEISMATGLGKPVLFKHLIAMRQFGKVAVTGERDDQLVFILEKGNP